MNVARVRNNYNWATICWEGWQATGNDGKPREIGEILIHSSFGSWGYQWGHLGVPFAKWLPKADRSYVAGKFLGSEAYVFDGEKTVRELRRDLLQLRRDGEITKNDARTIWDFIEDNELEFESSVDSFVRMMYDCMSDADWSDEMPGSKYHERGPGRGARYFLEEPWERTCTSLNNQFVGFWRELWPVFIEQLKEAA